MIGTVGTLRPSDAFVPHVHLCRSAIVVVVVVVVVAVVDSGTQKRAAFSMTTADERKTREQNGRQKKVSCFVVFSSFLPRSSFHLPQNKQTGRDVTRRRRQRFRFPKSLSIHLSIYPSLVRAPDFVLNKETRRGEQ